MGRGRGHPAARRVSRSPLADTPPRTGLYLARRPASASSPLYWSRPGEGLHVASEIKALTGPGAPVSEVPPGHHGWAESTGTPSCTLTLDLLRLGDDQAEIEDPDEAAKLIRSAPGGQHPGGGSTPAWTVGVILLPAAWTAPWPCCTCARCTPTAVAFTHRRPGQRGPGRTRRRLTADLGRCRTRVIEVAARGHPAGPTSGRPSGLVS